MRFLRLSIFTLFLATVFFAPVVFAIDLGGGLAKDAAAKSGYNQATSETTFAETVGTVIKFLISVMGIIFTSLMVYAGFLWFNSRGESEQIEKAKEIIKAAIIGLVLVIGSYSITNFVMQRVLERTIGALFSTFVG